MGCRIDLPLARRRNGQTRRANSLTLRMGVGLVAALLLLLTFARLVNLSSVLARLQRLSLVPALLCGAPFLCAYVVRALRWRRILAPSPVSASRAVAVYQVATFVNWLLPIRGGEFVKSLLLKRLNDIPISASLP